MPGLAVHLPLIAAFSFTGLLLCGPHLAMRWLLIGWVVAGVYLGRDITILCHYNPLLTLASWAACGFVLLRPQSIANFGASHGLAMASLSFLLAILLVGTATTVTRKAKAAGAP